jgi:hypothetical protein
MSGLACKAGRFFGRVTSARRRWLPKPYSYRIAQLDIPEGKMTISKFISLILLIFHLPLRDNVNLTLHRGE